MKDKTSILPPDLSMDFSPCYGHVSDRLRNVKLLMKDNYPALGFLPMSRIEKQERKGLVFHQYDNDEWMGYLVVGAIRAGGITHIWQECVDKTARGYGSGTRLFHRLLDKCKRGYVHQIQLRCAEDLESNLFWRAMGFEFVKSVDVGNARKRRINYYRFTVTPSLFDSEGGYCP